MSIKSEIEKLVRVRQRGMRLVSGDQFWRGLSLVTVIKSASGSVDFEDVASGKKRQISKSDFLSQALIRVPKARKFTGSLVDQAWAVVGNRDLTPAFRMRTAREYVKASKDPADREKMATWIFALKQGREPKK